jgi:signal transduction histidine kinase/CheY-like chemotaxis protein
VDLAELRRETLRVLTRTLVASALVALAILAASPSRWGIEPLACVGALSGTALLVWLTQERQTIVASGFAVVGLALAVTYGLVGYDEPLVAALYPLVALVAGALLGWPWAVGAGLALAGALWWAGLAGVLPTRAAEIAAFLMLPNVLVAWLLTSPTRMALDWSWSSYQQARVKTEEARDRQAELARMSRQLEETVQRLELANDELERARKVAVDARRLKSEFAAAISHELRTPLNLIIGFGELLMAARGGRATANLPPALHGDVEAIYRNACHLSSLIDDVLELSQVEARRLGFHKEAGSLYSIVEEAFAAVETLLRDRGLGATIDLAPDLPLLNVDRTRIRQVLINLLINAARFTFQGGLTVRAFEREGDIVVTVADTGIGIPPEDLANVFEQFHQVDGFDRSHHSGLGLTICKQLVELHGGSIWAESIVGEGSRFSFSLPTRTNVVAVLPDQWETWASPAPAERAVLVLSDDRDAIKLFERFLDGYRTLAATSVAEGLRATRGMRPSALIAVGSAGGALADALRARADHLRPLPVVACAIRTICSLREELGTADYLIKPVTREQIAASLRTVARGARDILVVDDDPDLANLLARLVESTSSRARVRCATGGAAGLELMRQRRPDLVLVDLLMPDVDGYAVIEQMRGDAALRDVPVVVVSARGAEEHTVTVESLGLSRPGGLTVGETMACLKGSLDQLVAPPAPAQGADSAA